MEYKIIDDVTIERVGAQEEDDYIIYSPVSEDVIVVNVTAGMILTMLQEGNTAEAIIERLSKEYEVDKMELETSVHDILEIFCQKGIVVKDD